MKRARQRLPGIKQNGKQWIFRITGSDGRRKSVYSDSYKEAQKKRNEILSQKLSRTTGSASYKVTFSQAVRHYLVWKQSRNLKDTTILRYKEILDNFMKFLAKEKEGYKYIDEITQTDISSFISYEVGRGLAVVTVNDELSLLKDLYDCLIDDDYIQLNPVRRKRHMLKQGHKDPIRFTRAEFLLLLNEAKKLSTKINWYAIFVSYGITGMRRDELRYLKCKDVHLGGKVAYIHCDETKTGNPKDVPIHPQLLPVLHDIMGGKNPEDYVFTNTKGNHFHKHDFTKQLKRICKRLGILPKKAHLHTLRRTFASISLEKKMPAGAVQKIGGWKDREVMERHYVGVEKDWAVEQYFKVDYLEELNGK